MRPQISEFSYGFALTNELVGWAPLHAAPIFPSLIEEGKKGGGYDVKLNLPGVPLYLQFKRADCMSRRSAREIRHGKATLKTPFHRFPITERNESFQHTSLFELDDGSNFVFYVAPRFHKLAEINSAWSDHKVAQRSIFVAPRTIGLIDDDDHHSVAYDAWSTYFCSKATLIEALSIEDLRLQLSRRLKADDRPLREQLGEWQHRLRTSGEQARRTQAELDRKNKERRLAERREQEAQRYEAAPIDDGAFDAGPLGYSIKRGLRVTGFERPVDFREVPSLPEMDIVDGRELSAEEGALRDLSDEAQRSFNAQLFVVQPRTSD